MVEITNPVFKVKESTHSRYVTNILSFNPARSKNSSILTLMYLDVLIHLNKHE